MSKEPDSTVGSIYEEALQRKERLRQLRKRAHDGTAMGIQLGEQASSSSDSSSLPKPIFRNYKPTSEVLKAGELPKSDLVDLTPHVKVHLESGKSKSVLEEVNLTTLAPRKPDWDLKRNIEKRLKKLEKRTQRAIAELIRDRLKESEDLTLQ